MKTKHLPDTSKAQALYNQARYLIPGATSLFGKRQELYLPNAWPTYYKKAWGCYVRDIDDNEYIDFSMVGIGTCVLGYSNKRVNKSLIAAVNAGSMCTLNSPAEIELAKCLLGLHKWAEMVRYARTGGEINTVAVRITRAATGKNKIIICGYHGWHDWFLAANIEQEDSLKSYLLPDLMPNGVPQQLKGCSIVVSHGDIESIEKLLEKDRDIAAIFIEPFIAIEPDLEFLRKLRRHCTKHGVALVFDEITSGFRETIGGLHLKYDIVPDICILGKAMSNGFPMAACIGTRAFMESASKSFISSTYWSESTGPTAALATIHEMQRIRSDLRLEKIACKIMNIIEVAASNANLRVRFSGSRCSLSYSLDVKDWQASLTLITQEMLKRGILIADRVYANVYHSEGLLERLSASISDVFVLIAKADLTGSTMQLLETSVRVPLYTRRLHN
jgi:glutamate-1-semialdehyde 2,1-aminomutase